MPRPSRRKRSPRRTDLWPRAWRRHPIALALILSLSLLVIWGRVQAPAGSDHDRYHDKTFTCARVVDGDTIDIAVPDGKHERTRIRLWGVDTPETAKSPGGAGYFGAEASAFTTSLVLDKPVRVVLAPDKTRDKYERLLAYVYLEDGETMLNEALINGGCAYADHRFPHAWKERFLSLEEKARKKGVGLWAGVTPERMPEWRQRYDQWRASGAN